MIATAWPPTSKYSTPWSLRDLRKSRKSALSDLGSIIEFAEEFEVLHPLDRSEGMPPETIGLFHLRETAKPANDRFDHPRPGRG